MKKYIKFFFNKPSIMSYLDIETETQKTNNNFKAIDEILKDMNKKTKLEIIDETVKFYSLSPHELRSKLGTNCLYNDENGNHCAVGRCLLPEYQEQGTALKGNFSGIAGLCDVNRKTLEEMLQEKYQGHDIRFWLDLQKLHDNQHYWNSQGLTQIGNRYVEEIKKKI